MGYNIRILLIACYYQLVWLQLHYLSFVQGVEIREYNAVQYSAFESLSDFESAFVDPSGIMNENVMVGIFNDDDCRHWVMSPNLVGVQRASGVTNLKYVTVKTTEFPVINVDTCAEVLFYKIGSVLTAPSARTTDLEYVSLNLFINEQVLPCQFDIVNTFPFPVSIVWHDESQDPSIQLVLRPATPDGTHRYQQHMNSFLGHLFSIHRGVNNENFDDIVDFFIAGGKDVIIGPEHRMTGVNACIDTDIPYFGGMVGLDRIEGSVESSCLINDEGNDAINIGINEQECRAPNSSVPPHNATHVFGFFSERSIACRDMAARFQEYSHGLYHEKRLALNYVVPQMVRPVTKDGFRKTRLPETTHSWLKQWFLDERARLNRVVESDSGPCMNQFAAPTIMTHLTPELKDKLSAELYPILKDWYITDSYYTGSSVLPEDRPKDTYERMTAWRERNAGELILTSIYGVRRYQNGSVLRMHVDTSNTHVISAIINVNQEDISEGTDWPLLILDHDEKEHWVSMQPGDLVLYESAKLLHGRPTTLSGGAYDNIFIHYMPEDEETWDYGWI